MKLDDRQCAKGLLCRLSKAQTAGGAFVGCQADSGAFHAAIVTP